VVTDYTTNNLLTERTTDSAPDFPGPFGQQVMDVALFDEHAEHGSYFQAGDYVELLNVKPKLNFAGLGAAIHGNFASSDGTKKINVNRIRDENDERLKGLKE
jgi:hypothetical protein